MLVDRLLCRGVTTIQRGPAPPVLHNSVAEAWFGTFKEELIHGRWGRPGRTARRSTISRFYER